LPREPHTCNRTVDRFREIGIVHDDHRALAAKLKGYRI
jgi:hypothetical protein